MRTVTMSDEDTAAPEPAGETIEREVVVETPEAEAPEPEGEDFWGDLSDDFTAKQTGIPTEPPAPEETGEPAAELEPGVEQPPAAEEEAPAAEVPEETPAETPEPESPAEEPPAEEPAPEPEPEPSPEEKQQQREEYMGKLEKHFEVPENLHEQLREEPERIIPQLLAKAFDDTMATVRQVLANELPGRVDAALTAKADREEFEQSFFEAWPKLKDHSTTVAQLGAIWRQMNPKGSTEDFIQEVGAQAMARLKIPFYAKEPAAETPAPAPAPAPDGQLRPMSAPRSLSSSSAPNVPAEVPADDDSFGGIYDEFIANS